GEGGGGRDRQWQFRPEHRIPPFRVDCAPARGGSEPGSRVARDALTGPGGERRGVGVLDALLGQVEITGDARRRGEHERPLTTVRVGDRGGYRARLDAAPGVVAGPGAVATPAPLPG